MKVYHAGQSLPVVDDKYSCLDGSIFLAGPTPRTKESLSWRPKALDLLREMKFTGSVFVPETVDWWWLGDYDRQVDWEWQALGLASCVLFWVPRELKEMPAFTTNVEFGFMVGLRPDLIVLGYPENAKKTRYLASLSKHVDRFHRFFHYDDEPLDPIPTVNTLRRALELAVEKVNDPGI